MAIMSPVWMIPCIAEDELRLCGDMEEVMSHSGQMAARHGRGGTPMRRGTARMLRRLAVVVHELQIRVLPAGQQTPELKRRLAGRGMSVFCHVNDQVLTDEEGYVRSKGVVIKYDGIKNREISKREPDGKEMFGQHSASTRKNKASDGKVIRVSVALAGSMLAAVPMLLYFRWGQEVLLRLITVD
ncbi:hypothetical protein BDR22DRAFT_821306 [Usnea florida]